MRHAVRSVQWLTRRPAMPSEDAGVTHLWVCLPHVCGTLYCWASHDAGAPPLHPSVAYR